MINYIQCGLIYFGGGILDYLLIIYRLLVDYYEDLTVI